MEQRVFNDWFIDDDGNLHVKFIKIIDCLEVSEISDEMTVSLNASSMTEKIIAYLQENQLTLS